jgi:hypothetical protein
MIELFGTTKPQPIHRRKNRNHPLEDNFSGKYIVHRQINYFQLQRNYCIDQSTTATTHEE